MEDNPEILAAHERVRQTADDLQAAIDDVNEAARLVGPPRQSGNQQLMAEADGRLTVAHQHLATRQAAHSRAEHDLRRLVKGET